MTTCRWRAGRRTCPRCNPALSGLAKRLSPSPESEELPWILSGLRAFPSSRLRFWIGRPFDEASVPLRRSGVPGCVLIVTRVIHAFASPHENGDPDHEAE